MVFRCNICFEDIEDDTKKCVLDCHDGHIFCKTCIIDWFKTTIHNVNNTQRLCDLFSCPLCKNYAGYDCIKRISSKNKFIATFTEKSLETCLCREDSINNPFGEAKFCTENLTENNARNSGGIVTFDDGSQIGMCKTHYAKFRGGEELYHLFHGFFYLEKSEEEKKWVRRMYSESDVKTKLKTIAFNPQRKCTAKTKLGHRCTRKYTCFYENIEDDKQILFFCNQHEKIYQTKSSETSELSESSDLIESSESSESIE